MLRTIRFIVAALITLVTAASVAPAFAAPAGWQSVDVTFQTEQQQSIALISGELPETAKLPYETELAVPAGMKVQWIGEILGGPAAEDPELKYVKSTVQGMDIYRFTLTKSRIAMIEGTAANASGFDGTTYTSAQTWTAWQAVPQVRISQRVPNTAQIAQISPGATLQTGDESYNYYTKTVKNPKAGDVIDLSFSYTLSAAGAAPKAAAPASADGSSTGVVALIAAVLIGGLGFLAFKVQSKMNAKNEAVETTKPERGASKAQRQSSQAQAFDEPDETQETEDAFPPEKKARPLVPMLIVITALVAGVVYAAGQGTTARVDGGVITKSFSTADPCATASIPIVAKPGVDLAAQGAQLVEAFNGVESITDVTLDLGKSTIDVGYCESVQTEASVRQIVAATGLVSVGAAPAGSATATASVEPSATK